MIGKAVVVLLAGGTFVAADLPNPDVGECAPDTIKVTRTEPTMIDPDGDVTGIRVWHICSYQEPVATGGFRTVDKPFWTDYDLDDAELLAAAAIELLEVDDVYMGRP